jgi:hypothetical protein
LGCAVDPVGKLIKSGCDFITFRTKVWGIFNFEYFLSFSKNPTF